MTNIDHERIIAETDARVLRFRIAQLEEQNKALLERLTAVQPAPIFSVSARGLADEVLLRFFSEGWRPTAEAVNALPEPLRRYVHDLETRCDPAGDVQTMAQLRDEKYALTKLVEELETELARRTNILICDEPGCSAGAAFSYGGGKWCHMHEVEHRNEFVLVLPSAAPRSYRDISEKDFVECAACAAKPGSPVLCTSCLTNRATISRLRERIAKLDMREIISPSTEEQPWKG